MNAHTIVVGGGVMGAAIAWHLARGRDPIEEPVVLFEKSALAAGSSGRSGAILRQFYTDPELVVMARDSLRVYANFQARTGRAIGFQKSGVLTIAGPDQRTELALVERNAAMMRSFGIDARLLDAIEMRALVPGIEVRDGSRGCFEPDAGGVDPVRTVEAFAVLAREEGAVTRIGVRAERIVVERGRVRGVITDSGLVSASEIVVAAGPWARPLLAEIGVDVPLSVVRPEQHALALPRASASIAAADDLLADSVLDRFGIAPDQLPPAPHPVVLDLERGFYTRCEGHAARTRVGRMDNTHDAEVIDPDVVDDETTREFKHWARASIEARLPIYREQADAASFTGLYTLTPDGQALIGRWPGIAGLVVVTGFNGHGFKLAPSVGEGVAQIVRDEPVTAFDERFFAPDRFLARKSAQGGDQHRVFGL